MVPYYGRINMVPNYGRIVAAPNYGRIHMEPYYGRIQIAPNFPLIIVRTYLHYFYLPPLFTLCVIAKTNNYLYQSCRARRLPHATISTLRLEYYCIWRSSERESIRELAQFFCSLTCHVQKLSQQHRYCIKLIYLNPYQQQFHFAIVDG